MKIFINDRVPGADSHGYFCSTWENAIQEKSDFLWIRYETYQETSRWKAKPRSRPYLVEHIDRHSKRVAWNRLGAYKTLDSALLAATKYAIEKDHYHIT